MGPKRHPLAACESCPLNEPGNVFVPSLIPTSPEVMMVGEAPGWQEAVFGRPFTGPSGQVLKRALKKYGFRPSQVGFTNVCLCRPPDNATPPKAAINACKGRLVQELANSGVRDVVALGGTAASVLVDDPRTITTLRIGPPKSPSRALDRSNVERVVATWHPAFCLRNTDAYPDMLGDIGKLRETNREPWREPEIRVFDDPINALAAIDELRVRTDTLVVDIEVGFDKDESFFHPNEYDLLCVGLAYAKGRTVVFGSSALADDRVRDAMRGLLTSKRLVAHNGKFDLAGLYPYVGALELYFDTMLASYTLDERPGHHGLKVLAVEVLGAPKYDDELRQYIPKKGNYADVPRPILYRYNALDVACTWDLYELFSTRLSRSPDARDWPYPDRPVRSLRDVHNFMVAAANQLMYLELNGIAFDLPYNFKLTNESQARLGPIEDDLNATVCAGTKGTTPAINPRSPKQVSGFLASQGISVKSTNRDTLEAILPRLAPETAAGRFVSTLLRHRREQKLLSTYVRGLAKRVYRGRVYTTYLLHGTTSGRLASRNPNLQNIVRDKGIKRQFVVSRPDHVLVQADYKNVELRVMATLAQDSYLRRILSDPSIDIFDDLADQIYGKGKWRHEVERVRIKAFVYGTGYGREYPSIAAEYGMSLVEGKRLQDGFKSLIPGVVRWQEEIKLWVHSGKDLITPFGRHRRFPLITKQNKKDVENEALSFLPQSTASDICLSSLIDLRPLLRGMAFIRLTIHDALTVECHKDRQDEVSDLLVRTMGDAGRRFTDYVPFPVDVKIGPSWGDL